MASRRGRQAWRTVVNATSDAYLSMTSRPARTVAMIAGILLGVASASTAVLLADTQQAQIDLRFDAQRSPYVMIQAQDPRPEGFTAEATEAVVGLGPVSLAGELSIWRESVPVSVNPYSASDEVPLVVATSDGLVASESVTIGGVSHAALDAMPGMSVVWVGTALAQRLGINPRTPQTLQLLGRSYSVVGLVQNNGGFEYINTSVVMSSDLARQHYGGGQSVRFLAQVRPGSASAVGDYALAVLDPSRTQRLVNVTQPDGEILRSTVAHDMRRVGVGLGAFVGFVGMVAVANTLNMAVSQRSRELGLRSAIGWSRARIGALILLESAVAGLVAALMGCVLGMVAAFAWSASQGWVVIINPWLAPVVVAAGTAFSVLGGTIPAYRAASVSPLTAMRS